VTARLALAERVRLGARRLIPRTVLRRLRPGSIPAPGRVDLGDLRRTRPISRHFGFERGQPIDRWYIERFLAAHATDIRGRVLEAGDASYTDRFGGGAVSRSDVLHVRSDARGATIVGDLADGSTIPSDAFDCIVLTQTLHLIFDLRAAVATLHRALAPGGVLLATVPGISQLERGEWADTWYWSLTPAAARRLLESVFEPDAVTVAGHGNVLASVAFLEGLASAELEPTDLAVDDPAYPLVVTVRAVKAGST
jgi:SAM-dependent methyltransferase